MPWGVSTAMNNMPRHIARAILLTGVCAAPLLLAQAARAADVTEQRLESAASEPDNWITHHHTLDGQRFSSLDKINRGNVKNLHVAWTMALGGIEGGGIWSHGGLEGTPLVESGYMFATDGWGSVYKIDMHDGHGKLLWKM